MDVDAIISSAADDADDFLAGVTSMKEARPAILEYLKVHYTTLSAEDTQRAVAGLLALLEEEGFFNIGPARDSWDEADNDG